MPDRHEPARKPGLSHGVAGTAIGEWMGEPLHHANLNPDDYRTLLAQSRFEVIAHTVEDPACGGSTVWLARRL